MFKIAAIPFLFLIIILSSVSDAGAWDDAGHKTTAYIAWQQMSPAAREKAFNILMSAPEDADLSVFYLQDSRSQEIKKRELFMVAATWADIVRDRKFKNRFEKYHKSNWHYDDTFWTTENGQIKILPNPGSEGGVAVERLIEFDKLLRSATAPDDEKAIALAWVLHLGGDIHQPLHTSARVTEFEPKGDQGGNLFMLTPKDTPRERSENLHWFWDSILGRVVARNDMADDQYIPLLGEMMMRKYPAEEMQNRLKTGNFREWQQEGVKLSMTEVFSPDLIRFETPSAKYRRKAFELSEEQLTLAGYRLGAMLNQIFGEQISQSSELTREYFDKNLDSYKKDAVESRAKIGSEKNDLWLWVMTRAALIKTDDLRDSTINVDVENSVITLKGTVGSKEQKLKAVIAAKQIEGVIKVIDLLKISN